jgi:hypothetical protein
MKVSLLCGATLFSAATFAFPANLRKGAIGEDVLAEINALMARITKEAETQQQPGLEKRLSFNAEAQRVSNTGDHRYVRTGEMNRLKGIDLLTPFSQVAPGPNDLRGPCPGLNAMANHGYLPHNGISSILQMTTAANQGTLLFTSNHKQILTTI